MVLEVLEGTNDAGCRVASKADWFLRRDSPISPLICAW